MRKSIVIGFVILALIVLISPGIVGKLAERSVDTQLEWAADENREIEITASRFDRSWFSSEGTHRIEFADTPAGAALRDKLGFEDGDGRPAIIIETRLDHGIVPVSSVSGENASLMPGLGRATSHVSVEAADGTITPLPGVIHTSIALTGAVNSRYALEPGGTADVSWGAADVEVYGDARKGRVKVAGWFDSFSMSENDEGLSTGRLDITADMTTTPYGFSVGDLDMRLASIDANNAGQQVHFGPLTLVSRSSLAGDRVDNDFELVFSMEDVPDVGTVAWTVRGNLKDLEAASLGRVLDGLERASEADVPAEMFAEVEADLKRLVAAGFAADFEQLDVTLPEGTVGTSLNISIGESDPAGFVWTGVLLALQAKADLNIPKPIFDRIAAQNPNVQGAVAMGFLQLDGDTYRMAAEYRQGLLTVNGNPVPIPVPSM